MARSRNKTTKRTVEVGVGGNRKMGFGKIWKRGAGNVGGGGLHIIAGLGPLCQLCLQKLSIHTKFFDIHLIVMHVICYTMHFSYTSVFSYSVWSCYIYNASISKRFPGNDIKRTILVLKLLQISNFQHSWSIKSGKKHSKFLKNLWILVCNGKRKTVLLAIFCSKKKRILKISTFTYIHTLTRSKEFNIFLI